MSTRSISDTREHLLSRKFDLFSALRQLEDDRRDGVIDENAYQAARTRYETEAAGILEQLESLPTRLSEPDGAVEHSDVRKAPRASRLAMCSMALVVAAAIVLFLVSALHSSGASGSATGSASGPSATAVPRASAAIKAAERAVLAHPRSAAALISLGNAYLNTGDATSADHSYQAAMAVAPESPEPQTLHAMVLGSSGNDAEALTVLSKVERAHPTYAKAWLLDGLISAHKASGYTRAIGAWRRFLEIQPHSTFAASVRQWIRATEKAEKARKR